MASQIEASAFQVSGSGICAEKYAKQLGLPSALSAAKFLLQMPSAVEDADDTEEDSALPPAASSSSSQNWGLRVRFSRSGGVEVLFAAGRKSSTEAKTLGLQPWVRRSVNLQECVRCTYKDGWKRLPPPPWLLQSLPSSRKSLSRWMESGGFVARDRQTTPLLSEKRTA